MTETQVPEETPQDDEIDFDAIDAEQKRVSKPDPPGIIPQIRDFSLVTSKSAFEQQVLDMLDEEFERLDDSARAAARFERQTLERLKAEKIAEGYNPDDAGELPAVFDVPDFTARVAKLVELAATSRIIGMLGLGQYRDEIISNLISASFAPTQDKKESATVYLGNFEQAQARSLRKK